MFAIFGQKVKTSDNTLQDQSCRPSRTGPAHPPGPVLHTLQDWSCTPSRTGPAHLSTPEPYGLGEVLNCLPHYMII